MALLCLARIIETEFRFERVQCMSIFNELNIVQYLSMHNSTTSINISNVTYYEIVYDYDLQDYSIVFII